MVSKRASKRIHNLQFKKFRKKYELFVAEGDKMVTDLLEQHLYEKGHLTIKKIYAQSAWLQNNAALLEKTRVTTETVDEKELRQLSHMSTPNQVLAVVYLPHNKLSPSQLNDQLVIGLEFLQDPGNMGNMIRVADWYGINHILCSKNCVDAYNSKVVQATMGSIGRVNLHYVDLPAVLPGIPLPKYATALEGTSIYKAVLPDKGVILFGNEAKGLSQEMLSLTDQALTIPRVGEAESLNIATSAAVVVDNFRRQHSA